MVGKIISIVNRKGGVGKTTLTLGLADTLVAESEKPYKAGSPLVLTVDLDPQASLTRALLYDRSDAAQRKLRETHSDRRTFAACIQDRLTLGPKIANDYVTHGVGPVGKHYSMLANEVGAWNVERDSLKCLGEATLKAAVREILKELAGEYRYVLIDAPPGQTVIAEAAIEASDLILCPTSPDLLSYWGLESFDEYLKQICGGVDAPPARFVFTKFKARSPAYDAQDRVHQWVNAFAEPKHYITLLREAGENSGVGGQTISLPFDPRLAARLDGAPHSGRAWPWTRMYTSETQRAFLRLVSAIKRELNNGEPRPTSSNSRATGRSHADRAGGTAHSAR